MLIGEGRKVYVAIDKSPAHLESENEKVIRCAETFKTRLDLTVRINETQAGVKFGVPQAVDWVFQLEERCIILEDDCVISSESLKYFDRMTRYLDSEVALISGDSPWDGREVESNYLSIYPLIWGWATNRSQWGELRELIGSAVPWVSVVSSAIKKPSLLLSLCFFLSAQIRVSRNQLQAWDCSLALAMILKNLRCVIPNIRLVENEGNDEFAHHTLSRSSIDRKAREMDVQVSGTLIVDKNMENLTNKAIRERILKIKKRHYFSPIKALLITK